MMPEYGFFKELDLDFEDAVEKVTAALKKEGFGVLTSIDMQEKFRDKLDIDFRKYVILGACNPMLAHKSIEAEENIGLFLPCNAIVYEKDGKSIVGIIRPAAAMSMIDNPALTETATLVEEKLKKVSESL